MVPPKITKIGKYQVLDVIGRGGMGMVYKAVDPTMGRPVAIKTVTGAFSDDPLLLKRFYREAHSTGKLQHANIVTVYDLGDQDGTPYLVMEYLEGESLETVIKERRPFTLAEKLNIILQVCEGLGYAHQHQIIHRDVKPGNVVVLKDGVVKIVDFGIAQLGNERFTRTGQVIGSLYYMSPEQIQGLDIDARSDIYSTGVLLFEFLAGVLPFQGRDTTSTLAKILQEAPPPLANFLKPCPPELDRVLQRALSKDRNERYTSMEDFAYDLQSVQQNLIRELIANYLINAEASMATKDWEKAREHLRQVLKFDRQHRRGNELLREVQKQIQKQQIREQADRLQSQARDALAARQWEEAMALLDQAIRLDPTNSELIEFRNTVKQSNMLLAEALRRAERAHEEGDLDTAKSAVEEALKVDPSDTTAKALNTILAKEIAERSKRRKIDDFVAEARKEIAMRRYTSALELLRKAEGVDASVAEVHQLIHTATAGREHERRRRSLEEACSEIEELLNRDEYAAACSKADAALQQFPEDLGLLKLRGFAEKQREAWTRRLFVESQILTARQLVEAGQLVRAQGVLNEALERYADDPGLFSLLATVTDSIARQESQRREAERQAAEKRRYINLQLSSAAELQRSGQTAPALKKLRDAMLHYPDSEELSAQISVLEGLLAREEEQRERAEQESRRRRAEVEREIAAARQLLGAKQTGQAVVALEQALRRHPESTDLKSELDFAQRRLAVEQAERERLEQAARRRRAEIEQELLKARQWMDSGQVTRAVAALEQVLRRYPESEELKSQLKFAQQRFSEEQADRQRLEAETRQKQEEIDKEIAFATQLLDSNQAARALATLEQALRRYPEDEKLNLQREFVRERVAAEEARREAAEQEQRCQREEIESVVAVSRQWLDRKQASRAVVALEEGLRRYPDSAELKTQLGFARERSLTEQEEQKRAEQEARLKREAIEREIAASLKLLEARQTTQALSRLEEAVRRFPESQDLRSQLEIARRRFTEENAEKQRAEQEVLRKQTEIAQEIAAAGQLLASGQSRAAALLLEKALQRYPGNEEVKSQLDVVRQRMAVEQAEREKAEQEVRRRQEEIAKEMAAAIQLQDAGRIAEAVSQLERAARKFPQDKELKHQLDLASQRLAREQEERRRAQEDAARRNKEIEIQINAARRWLESKQTQNAVNALEQATRNFPESAELRSLLASAQEQLKRERAEQEKAEHEAQVRRQSIATVLENAQRLLKANQTSKARQLLEESVQRFPESGELSSHLASTEARLAGERAEREEAEKRRIRLQSEIAQAKKLIESGEPEKAVKAIELALRSLGKEQQLQSLLETAKAAVKRKKEEERARVEELRQAEEQRRRRDRDLAELKKLANSAAGEANVAALEKLLRKTQELARGYPAQPEFQEIFSTVKEAYAFAIDREREQVAEKSRASATEMFAPAGDVHDAVPGVEEAAIPARHAPADIESPAKHSVRSSQWIMAAAIALVVVGAVVAKLLLSPKTYAVMVVTQPAGAQVKVGNQTCVTPNCRFSLPAGNYQVDTQLQGYTSQPQEFSVGPGRAEPTVSVVLLPLPLPLPATKGSYMLVRTGVDGVAVLIDGKKSEQTTAGGILRLPLDPGSYRVEVEKNGYLPAKPEQVRVRKDEEASVTFNLTLSPTNSALTINGAKPNVQVLADGNYLGVTGSDGSFSHDLSAGSHEIVLAEKGRNSASIRSDFVAGKSSSIDGTRFKFPGASQTPRVANILIKNLPQGALVKVDGQETYMADNSGVAQFEIPAGNHALELTKEGYRPKSLPQRAFATGPTALDGSMEAIPIDLESPAWAKLESSSDMVALQEFLNKFPAGSHAGQAQARLEKLVNDNQSESELENFGKRFSATPTGLLAAKKAERLRSLDQDKRDIQSVMDRYRAAYEHRDLNALVGLYPAWSPAAQKAIQTKFKNANSVKMDLTTEQPRVEGDQASIKVKQTVTWVQKDGSESVETPPQLTFLLVKRDGRWLLQKGP